MPKIAYVDKRFNASSQVSIAHANRVIAEYAAQGFRLTLRQLYYQFVSRDWIENTLWAYKRLGSVVNNARLAGLIDWNAIEDRTRYLRQEPHWADPQELLEVCAESFALDKWRRQPVRAEVWIEKDALIGVIEGVCKKWDVPFFSCRGYVSQSEMWRAAVRLSRSAGSVIFHLGDHDPSGIDMTRDIQDRLIMFESDAVVERIALTLAQVTEHHPPPNPAKVTDSRYADYVRRYGGESWELDALDPTTLSGLIEAAILSVLDMDVWKAVVEEERDHKSDLSDVADRWEEIVG